MLPFDVLPLAVFYQPLVDVAKAILYFLHDDVGFGWGMSIVGLTVLVRLAIVPLTIKQIKSMNAMRVLQPQIKEIQEKYKSDKQRMNQEMQRFFKENKVNPFSSCLPLLLQLPVFLALFRLLRSSEFRDKLEHSSSHGWLFITDLAHKEAGAALIVLIVLYIASQMAASLVMMSASTGDKTQQRIFLLFPLMIVPFIVNFPAGLVVYWITTNFWTLGQQIVVRKLSPPPQLAPAGAVAAVSPAGAGGGNPARAARGRAAPARVGPAKKPPPPPRRKKRRRR
jgi:YidC/Oxa1 family membrane protein insertase